MGGYQQRFQALTDLVLWLSILLVVIVLVAGGIVIDVLFGEYHAAANRFYQSMLCPGFSLLWALLVQTGLFRRGCINFFFFRSAMGAILNVALNLALIPRFGISGAAIATLVAQMVSGYLFNLFNTQTRSRLLFNHVPLRRRLDI